MSIMQKIGGFFAGGAMEVVERGADIAERWMPGDEKKHHMALEIDEAIEKGVDNARKFAAPGETHTWWDSLANGLNRLVRPLTTLGFLGGLFGLWQLPQTGDTDPMVLTWIGIVMTFWFGGRALLKDLPAAIKYLRSQ